jgi:hypothetical protein
MITRLEHKPGEDAPTAGTYELLNVLGAATGIEVALLRGDPMPTAPHGQTWTLRVERRQG